jgi:hypothetical protein
MEGYHQLLNEFNETLSMVTQNSPPGGAGAAGNDTTELLPLDYSPDLQVVTWYTEPDFQGIQYSDVSLSDFKKIEPSLVETLYIYNQDYPITTISNLGTYKKMESIEIADQWLQTVDIRECENLHGAEIHDNPLLTAVTSSGLQSLYYLGVYTNALTTLDASNLPRMEYIDCSNNQLTSINISGSFISGAFAFDFNENQIETIDLTGLTAVYVNGALNQLNSVNLTGADFTWLDLSENKLSTLDISSLFSLGYLNLFNNQLNQDTVDDILITLDANGINSGSLFLQGGTNASPSENGAIALDSLISKSWTVLINDPVLLCYPSDITIRWSETEDMGGDVHEVSLQDFQGIDPLAVISLDIPNFGIQITQINNIRKYENLHDIGIYCHAIEGEIDVQSMPNLVMVDLDCD